MHRLRRQATNDEETPASEQAGTTPSAPSQTTSKQVPARSESSQRATTSAFDAITTSIGDHLENVFNYADFTRTAGWQLVDKYSNHSSAEPPTLLGCTYRGRPCDSRVRASSYFRSICFCVMLCLYVIKLNPARSTESFCGKIVCFI